MTRRSVPLLSVAIATTFVALAGCSASDSPSAATSASPSGSASATVSAAPSQVAAESAAAWLVTAAAGAPIFQTEFDGVSYPDYGLTADVTLALLAVGDVDAAQPFAVALADPDAVAAYIGDGATAQYAGSTAKLLATLETAGIDTTDLDGRNLVSELVALQDSSGRFSDLGDDYSTTVSQAWAVLALSATAEAPDVAVDYLTAQQCAGAGFPVQLSDVSPADCVPDVDATAFAVSALVASGVAVDAPAVADALTWLEATSSTDAPGQFWAATGSEDASVNSTSVVAAALTDAGADPAQVLGWLESQILTTGADAGAFPLAGAPDVRTSAQATLALAGTGLRGLIG